jgi:DNA-binding XRE family transcriptional regulator
MEFDRPGFDREVGLRLLMMRKRRGTTQAALAEKIGLPRASYANIEAGRQRVPVDIVWRAAVVLGVPISSLVPEPVNKATGVEPLFPLPEIANGTVVSALGAGGSDAWTTMSYVGSSLGSALYQAIPHHGVPAAPAAPHKRPTVRIVRGSKSEPDTT